MPVSADKWDILGDVLISDGDIRRELAADRIKLDPYDPEMIQPASVDV